MANHYKGTRRQADCLKSLVWITTNHAVCNICGKKWQRITDKYGTRIATER